MRHRNHRHVLGVKKEHRSALMSNLAVALFTHGRIKTTLAKAKALRPFAEKIITLAKRAAATDDRARKLHYRRLALSRVRDRAAVSQVFDKRIEEFVDRQGGYIRIYKLGTRRGDAAEMALIELIEASDEGHGRRRRPATKAEKVATEDSADAEVEAVAADDAADSDATEAESKADQVEASSAESEESDEASKKPQ